jgi:hypothetical protein
MLTFKKISKWIEKCRGVLTTRSVVVYRGSYFGNNIIASNGTLNDADDRGFVPVELWIMSTVEADNPIQKKGEGLTTITIEGEKHSLLSLKEIAPSVVFGDYANEWPLTKILDIGGQKIKTSFNTEEIPPIPVHVHGGLIRDGKAQKPGKTEAYFFPSTSVSPYNKIFSAVTRIGLKEGITKDDIKTHLKEFGKNDSMFTLLNMFEIQPMTGWTVPDGVLHAPGPYITFEIQRPQDDYNLASWRLGERLTENELNEKYQELVLRGLKDEESYIEEVLDWSLTVDKSLKDKYFHLIRIIESGSWGRRYQIFFNPFYGEGWEVMPNQILKIKAKEKPQAGIVWSGKGEINGNVISQNDQNEFLSVPNNDLIIKNLDSIPLIIYTVEPIKN